MNVASLCRTPGELRAARRWVLWRYEQRDGRLTKVPYQARNRRLRASTTDPATWVTFNDAYALEGGPYGFVFADDPYCGIDLDGCRNSETGALDPEARRIVDELASYTEISPSRCGLHVIVRASLDGAGRNRRGPVEIYDRGRFFCMTGWRLKGTPAEVMPRQAELDGLRERLFPPPVELPRRVAPPWALQLDDKELLLRAFAARNGAQVERLWNGVWVGYGSRSEADLALCAHLAFWTGGDPERIDRLFRRSSLYRPKWERADYRERTIARAL